jgi:hypothetical protein
VGKHELYFRIFSKGQHIMKKTPLKAQAWESISFLCSGVSLAMLPTRPDVLVDVFKPYMNSPECAPASTWQQEPKC